MYGYNYGKIENSLEDTKLNEKILKTLSSI